MLERDEINIKRGVNGQWYWRRIAPNGKVIFDGSEGYVRKWNAKRAAKRGNVDYYDCVRTVTK